MKLYLLLKIKATKNMKSPTTHDEVCKFIGLVE